MPSSVTAERAGWRELGSPPSRVRERRIASLWAGAVVIAVAAPMGWALRVGEPWWAVAVVGLVGSTACRPRRTSSVAFMAFGAVVAVCGVIAGLVTTPVIGAWLAAGLAVGGVVSGPAALPAAILSSIAGLLAVLDRPPWSVALAAAGVVVVPTLLGIGGDRVAGRIDTFAAAVGDSIARVLFAVMSVPIVLLPFAAGRVTRRDGFGSVGEWARPPVPAARADSMWSDDRPRDASRRRPAIVVSVAVLVLAASAWAVRARADDAWSEGFVLSAENATSGRPMAPDPDVTLREPVPPGTTERRHPIGATPAAVANDEWWSSAAYRDAVDALFNQLTVWHHENPYRFNDATSEYINIENGLRRSWAPPPCECRRLTVWMYGGSTTWGIDQRDAHTVPSELARVAHEHGLTVDVQNRGLPAISHWLEAERFAWDLSTGARPDLVVFYDGVNEIGLGNASTGMRRTNEAPVDPAMISLWEATMARQEGDPTEAPPDARMIDTRDDPTGPVRTARDIVRRYDRAREMSRGTAEQAGIPVRYIWQASRYSRPLVLAEPHSNEETENAMRLQAQVTSDRMADDVIDLSDAFDDALEPIFTDDVHHNEKGSRIVAEAMFAELRSDLEALLR